jgi:hypothetical protein
VRHENSSVHVQGSNAPYEGSKIQIGLEGGHHIRFYSASYC